MNSPTAPMPLPSNREWLLGRITSHRRQIQQSPGVGKERQDYAIAKHNALCLPAEKLAELEKRWRGVSNPFPKDSKWCPDCGALKLDLSYYNSNRFHPLGDKYWDEFRPSWRPKRASK